MKIAPPLLGALIGGAALLVLAPATGEALGNLTRARADRAALVAEAKAPPATAPLVSPEAALSAGSARGARAALVARLRMLARSGGVLVEEAHPAEAAPGLAAVRIGISGAEKSVFALIDTLEREAPTVRLRTWEVTPLPDGGVRLRGEALAAWR